MKAKNILRISVFAALLCVMTILSAFAAEPIDAKIFRFDGMGNVQLAFNDAQKANITSDLTYKYYYQKDEFNALPLTTQIQQHFPVKSGTEFKLSEYPFIKIKYRTNYNGKVLFYVTKVNRTNSNLSGNDEFNIYSLIECWQRGGYKWKTKEFTLCNVDSTGIASIYNENKLEFDYNESLKDKLFFPTKENDVTICVDHAPFFVFKEGGNFDDDVFFELEYIAFFKNEADMKAYGNGTTDSAKVIRWDGKGNVNGKIDETKGSVDESGIYNYTVPTNELPNQGTYTSEFRCNVNFSDTFTLFDYPYLKIKYDTNFSTNPQWNIDLGEQKYIFYTVGWEKANKGLREIKLYYPKANATNGNTKFNYPNDNSDTWVDLTGSGTTYPSNDKKIDVASPFFQFKEIDTQTTPVPDTVTAKIEYVAFFKDENDMLAYGTTEGAAVDTAVKALLSDDSFAFTTHPATNDNDIKNYVLTKAAGVVANNSVEINAELDETYVNNGYRKYKLTASSGDYASKTIGINVKITELADITPTVKGAQIRTDGTAGLRFGFTYNNALSKNGYDEGTISYGTLLVPANLIGSNKITLDNVSTVLKDGQVIIADVPAAIKYDETNQNSVIYTAVVTSIDVDEEAARKDVEIIAVPYVKYKIGGTEYVAYGKQIKRSYNGILQDYTDAKGTWSTDNP